MAVADNDVNVNVDVDVDDDVVLDRKENEGVLPKNPKQLRLKMEFQMIKTPQRGRHRGGVIFVDFKKEGRKEGRKEKSCVVLASLASRLV
jgi:hypothetical protein